MSRATAAVCLLAAASAACTTHSVHSLTAARPTRPTRHRQAPLGRQLASLRDVSPSAPVVRGPLPKAADVSRQVMGWVALSDGRALAAVAPDALERARGVLAVLLSLDRRVVATVDMHKPMVVGLLNPTLLKGSGAAPVLALLPVSGPAPFEAAMRGSGMTVERTPWGLVARGPATTVCVAFRDDGYAALAGRPELVGAAAAVLAAPLAEAGGHAEAPLRLHLLTANVFEAYGAQIDAVMRRALSSSPDGDARLAFSLRGVRRAAELAHGLDALDLLVTTDGDALAVLLRAQGPADGRWAGFVASQQTAPGAARVWGAELVPRDAVLAVANHRSPQTAQADLEALVGYLAEVNGARAASRQGAWKSALDRVLPSLTGDAVYALWPGVGGGLGMGGAYRVATSAAEARERVMAAYQTLEGDLPAVVRRALELDASRPVKVKLVRRAAVMAGVPVDTLEVTVTHREATEKRRFEARFGQRLVLATAFVADAAVFAIGRDWRTRLPVLIEVARGRSQPSLAVSDPSFARALERRAADRVSLAWLGTRPMAQLLDALAREGGAPAASLAALAPMVAAIDTGAVVTTSHVVGRRFEIASRVPISLLGELPRLGGVLWRLGFAPLLDPPSLPPLPLPPSHLGPGVPAPSAADAAQGQP